jgi:hypothetical protein
MAIAQLKQGKNEANISANPSGSIHAQAVITALSIAIARQDTLSGSSAPRFDAFAARDQQVKELMGSWSTFKEKCRDKLGSVPFVGGFFEKCFQLGDAIANRISSMFAQDTLEAELSRESVSRQSEKISLKPNERSKIIFELAQIDEHMNIALGALDLSSPTSIKEFNKKIAESVRRMSQDLLDELERLELEKKKDAAEDEKHKNEEVDAEHKLEKILPGAGYDPRVAQAIAAITGVMGRELTDFDIRCIIQQLLASTSGNPAQIPYFEDAVAELG